MPSRPPDAATVRTHSAGLIDILCCSEELKEQLTIRPTDTVELSRVMGMLKESVDTKKVSYAPRCTTAMPPPSRTPHQRH